MIFKQQIQSRLRLADLANYLMLTPSMLVAIILIQCTVLTIIYWSEP